jgi:predicted RNA-binding Zn ribbon-like protein
MPEIARFRHGAGRLCLDFVRTLRYRGRPEAEEELPDLEALTAWIREFGPVRDAAHGHDGPATSGRGTAAPGDEVTLESAHQLREATHRLIEGARAAAGGPPSPEARELVNLAAARPGPAPRLDAEGHLAWRADEPTAATLSLVARDVLDLVSSDAIHRVRNCADPTCRALFYDGSRPGSRRWCSMDACGNRAKKATLRAKS